MAGKTPEPSLLAQVTTKIKHQQQRGEPPRFVQLPRLRPQVGEENRVLGRLAKQTWLDQDTFQVCVDTQVTSWPLGIEVIGHEKLGDWHRTPVFRLENHVGQDLRTWGGAFPVLDNWPEVLRL